MNNLNNKKIEFIKYVLLDSLLDDDEPLDVIFNIEFLNDLPGEDLKYPYKKIIIDYNEISYVMDHLLKEDMISAHDENEQLITCMNIDELKNRFKEPYSIYFKLTTKGERYLETNESRFWEK